MGYASEFVNNLAWLEVKLRVAFNTLVFQARDQSTSNVRVMFNEALFHNEFE